MEINCDAAELSREIDDAILPYVNACNVCCGAHAGDEDLIRGTIGAAIRLDVAIGAHPSWPDRENFGRRSMDLPVDELRVTLHQQITLVKSIAEQEGGRLNHVKPHGALYHDVIANKELAQCLADVVRSIDAELSIYGMAGSNLKETYGEHQIRFVQEAFADRRYASASQLRSRRESDAVIEDEMDLRKHVGELLRGTVTDVEGNQHSMPIETICIHSDTPNAVAFAEIARELIEA